MRRLDLTKSVFVFVHVPEKDGWGLTHPDLWLAFIKATPATIDFTAAVNQNSKVQKLFYLSAFIHVMI